MNNRDIFWVHSSHGITIGAVMSVGTGVDSDTAPVLFKQSLEKAIQTIDLNVPPEHICFDLAYDVRKHIQRASIQKKITHLNLLVAMTLFIYKPEWKELYIKFFGNGRVVVNGKQYDNNEGDTPDYLANYMNCLNSVFREYVKSRKELTFTEVENYLVTSLK